MKSGDFILISQIIPKTIQGEGRFVGEPSVFIRTAVCNLTCVWCDTKYSWEPQYRPNWKPYTLEDLTNVFPDNAHRWGLVVTGGEPMVWQKNATFRSLIQEGAKVFKRITFETNGTIEPENYLVGPDGDVWPLVWFSCSPKLSNSGEPFERRHKRKVLEGLNILSQSYFKFVVGAEEDVEEILSDFDFLNPQKIYLMPLGESKEALSHSYPVVVKACLEYGFQFTPRLHIELGVE